MIGNQTVGKTSIVQRYANGTFSNTTEVTTTSQYVYKNDVIVGKKKIRVVISDTPGKDIMLTQNTLSKLAFVFLVFDVSNRATFDKVIEEFIENYNEKNTVDTRVLYLLGNKTDKSPR